MNLDNINLDKIESLESGFFGTKCKGSVPLPNFTAEYESDIQKLIAKGQSTSIWKYPDVFLKTDANNPISTSGVCDCSVFYLFNKDKNTHFMYHIGIDTKDKDYLEYCNGFEHLGGFYKVIKKQKEKFGIIDSERFSV